MDFDTTKAIYDAYKGRAVSQTIHPNDKMYNSGKPWYFTVGADAISVILRALSLTWRTDVHRILDLPCGHGRVGRHLRPAFPAAEIFFCDIEQDGADFCAESFQGKAIYSKPDLTKVSLPDSLDLVWVGSLFTHIDRDRTAAWLAHIAKFLSKNGVIVATFRGLSQKPSSSFGGTANEAELLSSFEATGFGYATYEEFKGQNYGTTLVRPSAVMEIAENIPDVRVTSYTEKGWANRQDVLVLSKHDRLT